MGIVEVMSSDGFGEIVNKLGIYGFLILLAFLALKIFIKHTFERRVLIGLFALLSFSVLGASLYMNPQNSDTPVNGNDFILDDSHVGGNALNNKLTCGNSSTKVTNSEIKGDLISTTIDANCENKK